MIEHVVEQIDILYWESGAHHADDDEEVNPPSDTHEDDTHALYQNDDLTLDENIAKLPTTWPLPDIRATCTATSDFQADQPRGTGINMFAVTAHDCLP